MRFSPPSTSGPDRARLRKVTVRLLAWVVCLAIATPRALAVGQTPLVASDPVPGSFVLAEGDRTAPIQVDSGDWPGVIRAARDLQADIARVTGRTPALTHAADAPGPSVVIVGTIGRSTLVDRLIADGTIDVSAISGRWEASLTQVVSAPLPGVSSALVIAGSDKRGTIYALYNLSEQIGVSPWYWWADVTPTHREALFVRPGRHLQGPPSVKYRGIFLNDEAPALTNWVAAKYGMVPRGANPPIPGGVANYGREFHARLFEVLLRLRGNYLWPAMWNNAFNEDDPENARLADEYGIVMGTSHQEPMLRAQKEWDRRYAATLGSWNYATHPTVLENFWRDGVRRNRALESIYTIGLRGADDTEMAPGGPAANRTLLETIVAVQRTILAQEVDADLARVPQVWCLYKEVQDYYNAGMRVPDDVTLLWAEDNWGNVRRLPTAAERGRPGGAGIYYHFDYHGGPRSYQWLNTNPIAKIWDQMALAKQYGADRVWIVNVGHFKGYEFPLEFFLGFAWDTDRWTGENLGEFTRLWAEREFGPAPAAEIADLVAQYTRFNGRRKPELLAPTTYSLVNYHEAETVVVEYRALLDRATAVEAALPAEKRDAFYQLVLFPIKACALVNDLYVTAGKNALYARQGRASAGDYATATRTLFQQDLELMDHFNHTLAGGKWDHFMDQTHLGYLDWRDPPTNSLRAIPLVEPPVPVAAALGVTAEGTEDVWPGSPGRPALPPFDAFNRQTRRLELFNKGQTPFTFTATPSAPWVRVSSTAGTVAKDVRLSVSIDWTLAPTGLTTATIAITGAGAAVTADLSVFNPATITRADLLGFVETEGFVSIEPEHYTANLAAGERRWDRIAGYGRTLSGLRAVAPADSVAATPGVDAACLEYRIHFFTTGAVAVSPVFGPTLNFGAGRPLRYAVSFDDETPQVVTLVPASFNAQNGNAEWEESVRNNARTGRSVHTIAQAGYHTLKLWAVDPGVVVQKILVETTGARPSHLGPPESYGAALLPVVAVQPTPRVAAVGDRVSFTVEAAGPGPFSYQWRKDGADLPGGTGAAFWIDPVRPGDAGGYSVVVSNGVASVVSNSAALRIESASLPTIENQVHSVAAVVGQPAALAVSAVGATGFQWFRGGSSIPGADAATLTFPAIEPGAAGLYDCIATGPAGGALSAPVVVGVTPAAGQRTAGEVVTRAEWQDIHHPNGAIYDQFLLAGPAGTFSAEPDQIARLSFLDENASIVQVELSGAGAITVVLENAAGPLEPALYNQTGIRYMKGRPTVILAGADRTTHFTIYSVGTANNPGVTKADAPYVGWAAVAASGLISTDGGVGGIHHGNVAYAGSRGPTGLYAPGIATVGSVAVVHDIGARLSAIPYLLFSDTGAVSVKVAGSGLAQPNGDAVTVAGLARMTMGAGQDSCGRPAAAQPLAARLLSPSGLEPTSTVVEGP